MSTFASKVALFTTACQAGEYAIDATFEAFLVSCLTTAGLDQPTIVKTKVSSTKSTKVESADEKTRQLTGYNKFMSAKMKTLPDMKHSERMKLIGPMWKALSQTEQDVWNAEAKASIPVVVKSSVEQKKRGPKGMTNFQFYVQEKMAIVKADASVAKNDGLKGISALWKLESEETKAEYKVKAQAKQAEINEALTSTA